MGWVVTISAPSSAEVGETFTITGWVYDEVTGYPCEHCAVTIYYNGKELAKPSTTPMGRYSANVSIGKAGTYTLKAKCMGIWSEDITITIGEAPPPDECEPYWRHTRIEIYKGYDIHYFPEPIQYGFYTERYVEYPEEPECATNFDPYAWSTHSTLQSAKNKIDGLIGKISTSLTIGVSPKSGSPPLDVSVAGQLTRDDTGAGIPNAYIRIYRNGVRIASVLTDSYGLYIYIDEDLDSGSYDYYTEYEGSPEFEGCEVC